MGKYWKFQRWFIKTTYSRVAAEDFCAPDTADEHPRVPCGDGKYCTEHCAVEEILKDPWSDFLAIFWAGWVYPWHPGEDGESTTGQCVEVDYVPLLCVCTEGLESFWADVECWIDLCVDVDRYIVACTDGQGLTAPWAESEDVWVPCSEEERPGGLWEHSENCDVFIIAWAEMESFRVLWADCKSARFPWPDGKVSAPTWVKDKCLSGSGGDGSYVRSIGEALWVDATSSLTHDKGPKVVSVYFSCPNIPVESAEGSRFLWLEKKGVCRGKITSSALESSLGFWEDGKVPISPGADTRCSWAPSTGGLSDGECEMDCWDFWLGRKGPVSLEEAGDLCAKCWADGEKSHICLPRSWRLQILLIRWHSLYTPLFRCGQI